MPTDFQSMLPACAGSSSPLVPPSWYAPFLALGASTCIQPESSSVGAGIIIYHCDGSMHQNWWPYLVSSNQYLLVNQQTSLCLTVPGRSTSAETKTIQYPCEPSNDAALWTLQSTDGSGAWIITNVHSQMVLDVYGEVYSDGTAIQQFGSHGGPNQRFSFATGEQRAPLSP